MINHNKLFHKLYTIYILKTRLGYNGKVGMFVAKNEVETLYKKIYEMP